MAILTHGSDLRLAPTIKPIVAATDGTVRGALARLAKGGFETVQLDATLAGIRPRELSVRARKDLVALMARQGVRPGGVDLFLPRDHYTRPEHVDRAVAATMAAIGFAADIGRVPVSLALPVGELTTDVKRALVESADAHGVRLAVHAEDQLDALIAWLDEVDLPALGAAIDPAALIARGEKAVRTTQRVASRLAVARLSDVTASALRCPPGEGELDVAAYRITLDLAPGRTGPVVLDLRGLEDPVAAAAAAKTQWEKAAFTV